MSTTFKGTGKLDDVAVKFTNIFLKTWETALPRQRIAELVKQLAVQEDLLVIVESHAWVLLSIRRRLLWTAMADPPPSTASNENAGCEDEDTAQDDLDNGHPYRGAEVAVSNDGDHDQFDTHNDVGDV